MNHRRCHGLTLLELLIALALTGAMAVALAQWISIAASTSVRCSHDADSQIPVLAFFRLIQDDLDAVAFPPKSASSPLVGGGISAATEGRVHVNADGTMLSIATRIPVSQLPASVTVPADANIRYRWDQPSATITRQYFTSDEQVIEGTGRTVLAGVEKFQCRLGEGQSSLLTLEVALESGDAHKRSFLVR